MREHYALLLPATTVQCSAAAAQKLGAVKLSALQALHPRSPETRIVGPKPFINLEPGI